MPPPLPSTDPPAPPYLPASLPAHSRRQAMDWSLLLASQSIDVTVQNQDSRWWIEVHADDLPRAAALIEQFQHENRWRLVRNPSRLGHRLFHPAVLLWATLQLVVFFCQPAPFQSPTTPGVFRVQDLLAGNGWTLLTAATLHADLGHLASNLTFGILLIGLAMGRFGPGTALVLATACGAAGFGAATLIRDPSAASVGASGVIMGALGLLSAGSLRNWHHLPAPLRRRQVALDWIRGGMLFVLLGLSPDSDLVAHTGGFLTGLVAGTLACLSPLETTRPRRENALLATWFLSIAAAWAHALRP